MTETTPPDQPEDAALREKISKTMGWWAPGIRGIHDNGFDAYPDKTTKVLRLFREHEQEKVQAATHAEWQQAMIEGLEVQISKLKYVLMADDPKKYAQIYLDKAEQQLAKFKRWQATQPPAILRDVTKNSAADTTKQGEGKQ